MPAFHFDRRQLRRTAFATLVVWLFALTAGAVNACVLMPERVAVQVSHADILAHEPGVDTLSGTDHESSHEHDQSVDQHGHGHDSGKGSCQKFCDDESSAIAKARLPVVDLGATLFTVVQPWSTIVVVGGAGFRQSLDRPRSHGPPLVIRFLRLTL
jgi:hypothetical protein